MLVAHYTTRIGGEYRCTDGILRSTRSVLPWHMLLDLLRMTGSFEQGELVCFKAAAKQTRVQHSNKAVLVRNPGSSAGELFSMQQPGRVFSHAGSHCPRISVLGDECTARA